MAERITDSGGLVVRVAGVRWRVPFGAVVEVLRAPRVAPLPATRGGAIGVVNHRGKVLMVVDPVRALQMSGPGTTAADVVVVEATGRRFGVAVDGVVELVGESRTGIATLELDAVALAVFGELT